MKNYIIYSKATGEITQAGSCADADLPSGTADSPVIEGDGHPNSHFVKDGELQAYTLEQAFAKANQPLFPCAWSNTSFEWVDLRTFDEKKDWVWTAIKVARDVALEGGFTWDGSTFDSDLKSQAMIQGAVQLAQISPDTFALDWTLADNTVRTLTKAELLSVGEALGSFVQSVYAKGRELRQAVDSASTVQELESIAW